MEKRCGVFSETDVCGGVPALFVNGNPFIPFAYMTYFEQFNEYKTFSEAGCNFFSAPVLFAGRWINSAADTPAFKKGIFDVKDSPDFSLFDLTVEKILINNPDAYIFPRVNVSMPEWWENENPDDVNIREDGTSCRESLYSLKWRRDASEMLRQFVRYVNGSKYVSHVVGYQIAGGNTEEWFHFDLNAGYCKNAEKRFRSFLRKYYPEVEYKGLPDLKKLKKRGPFHNDEYLAFFLEYASFTVADAIKDLARTVKSETGGRVAVGTFYGYSLEVSSPLFGTHALKYLLNDKNIDIICSPCSYIGTRDSDSDWTEMYPADSVRLHGKMCFQECDIRTNLTTLISEKDISLDPERRYTAPIWKGPDTYEKSVSDIRKTFCRQLIKGNGFWWFDMWGGWFADPGIMSEMKRYKEIYSESLCSENRKSIAEIAVFTDESVYRYMTDCALRGAVYNQRKALGIMGTPYDIYDVSDFDSVKQKYKAFIFMSPEKTQIMKNAVSFCRETGVPYLVSTSLKKSFSVSQLRWFCKECSVKIYCKTDDVMYINNDFVSIHAVTAGKKEINLYGKKKICRLIPEEERSAVADKILLTMKKGETVLFKTENC